MSELPTEPENERPITPEEAEELLGILATGIVKGYD